MKHLLLVIFLFSTGHAIAQSSLEVFSNIAGSSWISEGKQLGGHDGKTVFEIEWGLDGKMIKVKTYTTDPKTLEFGLRNEGVRFLNNETQKIEFYEFDKLGSISKGEVIIDEKDIHYQYPYGDLILRDSWIYTSKDEYQFIVGSMKDGKLETVYHKAQIVRVKE